MTIPGVKIIDLQVNADLRGSYTEMYHDNWDGVPSHLPQWSIVHSKAHAIRGMRIHLEHADYTCLCFGTATYILKDLRAGSPSFGVVEYLELSGDKLQTIVTPAGVAHGFYFKEFSIFAVGITHPYDPADELGFLYKDPGAGITWPEGELIVSERDNASPPLKDVLPRMPKWVEPA